MKVLIFLLGYFLATLAQNVIVLNDINNIPICATLNNANKTFINIWQIYEEFKTTGQIWTPVATGACPQNNIDCTMLNPVCAVSSNNFFKTFPNRCVLETEQKTTGTVWNIVFNGICFVNQDNIYSSSPLLAKIYPANSLASGYYDKVLVPPPALREPKQPYYSTSYGAVPSPPAVQYNSAPQILHSPQYHPPLLDENNNIPATVSHPPATYSGRFNQVPAPGKYNPAPTPQPNVSSLIPENYNQLNVQVPEAQAPSTLYSSASKVYNSTPEPLLRSTYTVPSPHSDSYYQPPAPVPSPSYLSPSNYTVPSPDPDPVTADPLHVPAEYNPVPAQTYASASKVPSCLDPLPLPSYPQPLLIPGNYNQSFAAVPEVKAPLSLYSSPTFDTVTPYVTEVYNSSTESLSPSTYTAPSPISNSYYQPIAPVPSPSYLSPSNYDVPAPDHVPAIADTLPVPDVYNKAPTTQPYAPAIEIPSSNHISLPVPGTYNPEPLPLSSYPAPSLIPGNYNQLSLQIPEVQAPLYSSPSTVYDLPPEPLHPSTYTVPSPISDSYYKAPAPVHLPSYLSPSNCTVQSPDPIPTVVDPLPVPVDFNTAPASQSYGPAINLSSSDYNPSPVPRPYNSKPLPLSSYPAPSHIAGNYNQPVVQALEVQAPLSLYSSASIDTVPTPVTDVYNSPPEQLHPPAYTVPSPISDSYDQVPAPIPSPSYLSPSNYTVILTDPVPLPPPIGYNTAPTPHSYVASNKKPLCDHILSPVPGPYIPEPLPASSYPTPSLIPGNYNQQVVQAPKVQAPLSLYSTPSIDDVSTPVTDVYNSPPDQLHPPGYTVPSSISDSYYQVPAPIPSPSYLSASNYTVHSSDPIPTIVETLPVPVDYSTAPKPQSYAAAIEISSCAHNPSPAAGPYIPEPLPSSSYPAPLLLPGNYNQPVVQAPEVKAPLSLYSSASIDTVPTPVTDVYNSPSEPTYTVPSPISDSYYQVPVPGLPPSYSKPANYTVHSPDPVPVPSPSYLSPSNYTVHSSDPIPTIVETLPVPVDYSTAPKPQSYAAAIEISSCAHNPSPAAGPYIPEPLPSASYPAHLLLPGNYNQPVVQAPEVKAPLSLYSSPSYDTVSTPVTDVNNAPPEQLHPSTYTVPLLISDTYYHAPAPVPSPSHLSPSNYTVLSPDPVPLPVPVDYNTAPTPQSYAPAIEIPSSNFNPAPVPGPYHPEPLPSSSYPPPSDIPGNYNQPVIQAPEVHAPLSLYSPPSTDTVLTPVNDEYNVPSKPVLPSTYKVPSPMSDSYYRAPAPIPLPSYLSPANYTVLSPDPGPAVVYSLPVSVDYITAPKPQYYVPANEVPLFDQDQPPAPKPYNPEPLPSPSYPALSAIPGNYNQLVLKVPSVQASLSLLSPSLNNDVYIPAQEPPPSSTYPIPYNQVSASDYEHLSASYSAVLDPLAVPSSNSTDYKESFAAPVSSYSFSTDNPISSKVSGNYNSSQQAYYSHNDSSAGAGNYHPGPGPLPFCNEAAPIPKPYSPFPELLTTPSYPSPASAVHAPSAIPLYEPILSDPVPHYLPSLPASKDPPAVNNQYTTPATTTEYSSPSISNPLSNAYAETDSDKIPYKPVQNYQQSSDIYSASSEQPYNSISADTPLPSQTYQQLYNTTYSSPETSNVYAPDVAPCSNVETFSSPVLDYQNIPSYSQIIRDMPIAIANYSDKPNNNNIVNLDLSNQSDYNPNLATSYDKPKAYNEANTEHSSKSANNEGQTIYNGVVYQGPYYYIPKYKHINYGNFNFMPPQPPFAPAIPALVSAYPYVGTPFSAFSTNPFEQLLKQLQYIATKDVTNGY